MTPRAIELHIERVVLHGFFNLDRDALANVLRRELEARLLETPPAVDRGGAVDRLTAPPLPASATIRSAQLGVALAASLHGALSGVTDAQTAREGIDGTDPRA